MSIHDIAVLITLRYDLLHQTVQTRKFRFEKYLGSRIFIVRHDFAKQAQLQRPGWLPIR